MRPKSTSVLRVLSWASSRIITEYFVRLWSNIAYLNNMPSVMYFSIVLLDVRSSNLIA